MTLHPTKIYHIDFSTPVEDEYLSLNFSAISEKSFIQEIPDIRATFKELQLKSKKYIAYSNLSKITEDNSMTEENLGNKFVCLLWKRKSGEKFGILLDNEKKGAIGLWNPEISKNSIELERIIYEDIKNLEDEKRFEFVTLLF